jgi:endonuclease/exonuclease/phosphatase family metal-dependent hydrolase
MYGSLVALAAVAFVLIGCAGRPLAPRDPDPGAFHFTIQTYNLNNDEGGNLDTLAAIGQANADIICLQEITTVWQTAIERRYGSLSPHHMFKVDPGGGAAGLGILSRLPVRDGGWHAGPNGWHPSWYYFIDTPHGTFKILNTHLRNATGQNGNALQSYLRTPDDHRFEMTLFTAKETTPVPMIVLGDFNEGPDGAAVEYLEGHGFQNVLPLYHPGQPTWRYSRSVGGQFTQELDHILIDPSFEPLNAWVVNAGASDHLPVVAHLEAIEAW